MATVLDGRYELIEHLEKQSTNPYMVWSASDMEGEFGEAPHHRVAIKIFTPWAMNAYCLDAWKRQSESYKSLAEVSHPCLQQLFDYRVIEDASDLDIPIPQDLQEYKAEGSVAKEYTDYKHAAFLVTELVEGQVLRSWLRQEQLAPKGVLGDDSDVVWTIVSKLADVVRSINREGVTHSSIGLNDVIVTSDQQPKFTELGRWLVPENATSDERLDWKREIFGSAWPETAKTYWTGAHDTLDKEAMLSREIYAFASLAYGIVSRDERFANTSRRVFIDTNPPFPRNPTVSWSQRRVFSHVLNPKRTDRDFTDLDRLLTVLDPGVSKFQKLLRALN